MREAMKRITSVVLFLAVVLSLGSCANRVDEYAIVNGEAVILSAEQNADGKNDGKDAADTITEAELIDAINKAREEDGASSSEVTQLSSGKDTVELTREEMELVADILDTDVDVSALDDEELSGTVESLLEAIEKGSDVAQPDVYDENGGMKIPFDLAYPELIANGTVEYSDEALLIKMDNSYGGVLSPEMRAIGVGALEVIVPMDGATWYKASLLSDTTAEEALGELRELECVEVAEYDYQIRTASIDHYKDLPDDRHFDNNKHKKDQWYMHHFGIPDGYNHMKTDGGSESVIVAVIDTGVDYDHEDLADNIWRNTAEIPDNNIDDDKNGYVDDYYGVNVVAGKGNGDDDNGHGTHVAGIIAAQNNNLGTVGIAYNVTIMPIKAATASGFLNQSDIAEAVYYAYENGAEVINMSFGGSACSIAVQDALATAYTRCVLVASAGNDEENNEPTPVDPIYIPNYPAALTYVLGVMSVDENGVESNFTNYDVKAFNGVEYELYAPGDSIMSTLPGDTYGTLSGTSMAAPMVSAVAAILRSEYTDRDTYPTKFIYGQLASTSRYHATCLDPLAHGEHNLPQVVDLYSALTELPVPEVGVQDYALFDTEGLSYDTNGRNNGDGVIDAGETFALGLTLRNRWGMSEDTLVTIDTLSLAGIADPYITLHNPTVDYGSVGTYSTGDCGRVYTDGLLTGWESPFYVTVSDDCPNDYIFALNVTLRYENGLDESDKTVYINDKSTIILTVRNGVVLPSVIDTDMTLTSDNLYIIPNTTVIKEGVTVRVEAGTDIQFWTNDPEDPYADSYIASLTVGGRFLVEGTKEEPVRIYPSALMDRYAVSMSSSLNGFIALNYAEVVNPFMGNIDYADHCTFSYNYNDSIYYRTLSNGTVKTVDRGYGELPDFSEAKNCIFYKVGLPGVSSNTHFTLYGRIDRCIFVDCAIGFDDSRGSSSRGYMRNCVFLGNRVETEKGSVYHSTITAKNNKPADAISNIYYREQTGTTYILVDYNNIDSQLADELGLKYAIVETKDEAEWLQAKINRIGYDVGLKYDHNNEQYLWSDGTEIPDFIDCGEIKPVKINLTAALSVTYNNLSIIRNDYLGTTYCKLYELQGEILPTEITFDRYTVDLDVDTVYQIVPKNLPVQLSPEYFIYESGDTSVITVSDKGLVTPVGEGTADVTVYSRDRAVRNRITFTVRDYVPLESISFKTDSVNVAVGETVSVACTLTPADTTRNFVTYTSSDGDVVTVDAAGNINGISSGVATVTATCEGMTATITVRSFVKATSMEMDTIALSASLAEGERDLPDVITNEGAELQLIWRSVDESVATVENGKLVPRKTGTSTLVAEDTLSGLSCNALVIVREEAAPQIVEFLTAGSGSRNDDYFVLYDNGDLYQWDNVTGDVPEIYAQNVKDFDYNGYPIILYEDNTVSVGNFKFYDFSDKNPRAVVSGGVEYEWTGSSYFVLTESGNVYAWGYSHKGALGVGTVLDVTTPTLVNLDNVIKVVCDNGSDHTYFLTSDNKLYYAGEGILSPELVLECVDDILDISGKTLFIRYTDGKYAEFNSNHSTDFVFELPDLTVFDKYSYLQFLYNSDYIYGVGVVDGKVDMFKIRYTGATGFGNYIPGISDAIHTVMLKTSSKASYYVATAGGLLLGYGANPIDDNRFAGATTETDVTTPVIIPITPISDEELMITDTSLDESGVNVGEALTVTFNKALTSLTPVLYADGERVTVQYEIRNYNELIITRAVGWEEGVTYTLTLDAGTVHADAGITNGVAITLEFTYTPDNLVSDDTDDTDDTAQEPVVYGSILDESIERIYTTESLEAKLTEMQQTYRYNDNFYGNAILNRISTDTDVTHWLRILAPTGSGVEVDLGGNYWGTTDEKAIGLQIIDYTDFINYSHIIYSPFLTEAPEDTFPFVTSLTVLNKNGEAVTTVGNEEITVRITFNRDMDTAIPLTVRFGSAYPYGDYEISGAYVDARTWEGTYRLTTLIDNGMQYFAVSNGCSATDDLALMPDRARFAFEIDTTAAQALIMQGEATETGINLTWTQDDFDTLMGYNVYRSTSEDGLYVRLNSAVIPAEQMQFFDDTVEPGVKYYYNFTVVKTDLSESIPSGKITIVSKDTMAPNVYHSPVYSAVTGRNLLISATVTDNLNIVYAKVYYRTVGESEWRVAMMNSLNDKYSAIIIADHVSAAGIEYYIEAFDGVSYTYKGTADTPYTVTVQEAISADSLGDVNGDGAITNLDALMLLKAINDQLNLDAEQFARADLDGDGVLMAKEALRILQYVSGSVGSVDMRG